MRKSIVVFFLFTVSLMGVVTLIMVKSGNQRNRAVDESDAEGSGTVGVETALENVSRGLPKKTRADFPASRLPVGLDRDNRTGDLVEQDDEEAAMRKASLEEEHVYQKFSTAFEAEPVDEAWSKPSEDFLSTLLKAFQTKDLIIDALNCRSELCKISVAHSSVDSYEKFMNEFLIQSQSDGHFHALWWRSDKESLVNNTPQITVFLMRNNNIGDYLSN